VFGVLTPLVMRNLLKEIVSQTLNALITHSSNVSLPLSLFLHSALTTVLMEFVSTSLSVPLLKVRNKQMENFTVVVPM